MTFYYFEEPTCNLEKVKLFSVEFVVIIFFRFCFLDQSHYCILVENLSMLKVNYYLCIIKIMDYVFLFNVTANMNNFYRFKLRGLRMFKCQI